MGSRGKHTVSNKTIIFSNLIINDRVKKKSRFGKLVEVKDILVSYYKGISLLASTYLNTYYMTFNMVKPHLKSIQIF